MVKSHFEKVRRIFELHALPTVTIDCEHNVLFWLKNDQILVRFDSIHFQ